MDTETIESYLNTYKFMNHNKPKVLIIGSARHGKDTVAEILSRRFDLKFESSSEAASRLFIYDKLKKKYGYTSPQECFIDRMNHRKEWFDLIMEYNYDNSSRLAEQIMKYSDMYVGMRSEKELETCKKIGLFDIIVGVFNPRLPIESKDSFNIDFWAESDVVLVNHRDLSYLENLVVTTFSNINQLKRQ